MKKSVAKIYGVCASFILFCFLSLQAIAGTHFTESFTSPNFPVSSWAGNGVEEGYTLSSGTWNVKYAMGLEALNAYNSTGGAAKLNRFLESYMVSPAVNSIGTVSFYYRNFSTVLGGGSFKVQKSVNGGAYTDIKSVTFTTVSAYTFCSVAVNDGSNNIRIRIYCPNTNTSYLCIDEFSITDMGQALTTNPTSLDGFNYYLGNGPSTSKNFNLFGTNLTGYPGNITITAPTHYEVSKDNATFSSSLSVAYTSSTLSSTPIYVRLKSGLAINNYNSETITISGGGAASITVSCSGNVTTAPSPVLSISPTSLSGFTYVFGAGPSVAQSYSVSGTYLTGYPGNIVVTAPADYEVSLDYSTYSNSVNIPYTSGTLASKLVYVRLKAGLAVNTYNSKTITNIGGGASGNVVCSGSVSAPPAATLSVSASSLTGFNYITGTGPSTAKSYNLSGANLTGYPSNITVTAPTHYEVSLSSGSGYASSVNVAYNSATLSATPVYVRLKAGLSVASYNSEIVANAGGGATTVNVTCSGSVTAAPTPTLVVSSTTLSGFTYVLGSGPSAAQSYNLSGSNLTGYPSNITVTAPANYEVSLSSGSGYASSVNVAYTSATLASTAIYVRLKSGLAIASYNSVLVTNAGGGATTVNVTCNGSVTAVPPATLAVSAATLTGFTYVVGSGPSAAKSYNLSGSNLTGYPSNITVTAPTHYEVSLSSGSGYASSVNVAYTSATLSATPVYVRLKAGLAIGSYNSEVVANAGGGATTVNVTCSGTVTDVVTGPCLSENFSGFAAGTHASPDGTDISASLNTYTQVPGWTGSKIFQAGGEIKLGSSSVAGYIISPTIDLSAGDAAVLDFDIQIYATDAGKIQVFHAPDGVNFTQVGSDITPPATYTTQTITITGGTTLSKIKIGTLGKRFYLDNIAITCGVITSIAESKNEEVSTSIYPNPVNNQVTVSGISAGVKEIRIFDVTGNMVNSVAVEGRNTLNINTTALPKGMYFLNMIDESNVPVVHKIVKM